MSVYQVGPFHLNAERLTLTHDGKAVALGPKVVETLLALIERAGQDVTKDALLDRVWPEGFVEEANLAQNVYVLRKTFRSYGAHDPIATVPRIGYRLVAPARVVLAPMRRGIPSAVRYLGAAAVAAAIVAGSLLAVTGHSIAPRHQTPVLSQGGERLYLVGRYYWNLRTRDGVAKSLEYFARVVDSDPDNPLGYAALADANVMMGDYCYGTHRPQVYFARARDYAGKALVLDSNSAQAHAALGFIALHTGDDAEAASELRDAIALEPSYAPAHEWYGIALLRAGNFARGQDQLELASRLDPLSVATTAWLGEAAFADRRFADAISYSRQALELAPERIDALATIGQVYQARGETGSAVETFKRLEAIDPYYRQPKHHASTIAVESFAVIARTTEPAT